jgi:hypothetical protein
MKVKTVLSKYLRSIECKEIIKISDKISAIIIDGEFRFNLQIKKIDQYVYAVYNDDLLNNLTINGKILFNLMRNDRIKNRINSDGIINYLTKWDCESSELQILNHAVEDLIQVINIILTIIKEKHK